MRQYVNLRRAQSRLRWLPAVILSSALTSLLPLNHTPAYAADRSSTLVLQSDAARQPARPFNQDGCDGYTPIGRACLGTSTSKLGLLGEVGCEGYTPIGRACLGTNASEQADRSSDAHDAGYTPIG